MPAAPRGRHSDAIALGGSIRIDDQTARQRRYAEPVRRWWLGLSRQERKDLLLSRRRDRQPDPVLELGRELLRLQRPARRRARTPGWSYRDLYEYRIAHAQAMFLVSPTGVSRSADNLLTTWENAWDGIDPGACSPSGWQLSLIPHACNEYPSTVYDLQE